MVACGLFSEVLLVEDCVVTSAAGLVGLLLALTFTASKTCFNSEGEIAAGGDIKPGPAIVTPNPDRATSCTVFRLVSVIAPDRRITEVLLGSMFPINSVPRIPITALGTLIFTLPLSVAIFPEIYRKNPLLKLADSVPFSPRLPNLN